MKWCLVISDNPNHCMLSTDLLYVNVFAVNFIEEHMMSYSKEAIIDYIVRVSECKFGYTLNIDLKKEPNFVNEVHFEREKLCYITMLKFIYNRMNDDEYLHTEQRNV